MVEAQCDHLIFCGANRFGSVVQYLTQWPVTAEAVGVFTPGQRDALFVQWINHEPQAALLADQADVAWGGESSIATAVAVLQKRGARRDRVATIGPLICRPARRHRRAVRRAKQSQSPLHASPAGQVGGGDRLAAHRRAFHRPRHGGPARRAANRLDRARSRRSGRARLRQARARSISSTTSASPQCMRPISACRASFPRRAACRRATSWSPRSPRRSGIIPGQVLRSFCDR